MDPKAEIARRSAERLAGDTHKQLPQYVEAELAQGATRQPVRKYFDASTVIGLAGFVVAAAGLAWTIYQDTKKKTPQPSQEVVRRKVRLEVQEFKGISDSDQDRVIKTIVEEIVEYERSHR